MEKPRNSHTNVVSPAICSETKVSDFRHLFSQIQLGLAEEKARVLLDSLKERYTIPADMEARFIADKTADFLRSVTAKDRKDIIDAIAKDLKRRQRGAPAKSPAARRAAAWSNRWGILITGLSVG